MNVKLSGRLLVATFSIVSAPIALATTATSLSSFYGMEEPTVIYYPATDSFVTGDTYPNIQDEGCGVFKMELRYNPGTDGTDTEWWDGDRSTTHKDRGRAEVKGLGPHLFRGQTFDFISTWRTSPNFQNTTHFCHIWQGYGVNGESSVAFLAQMTLEDTGHDYNARVHLYPGGSATGHDTLVRGFNYTPGKWIHTNIEIYSADTDGYCTLSINHDAPQGISGVQTSVNGAESIRPKWGIYRYFRTGWNLGDEYVEHAHVQSNDVGGSIQGNFSLSVSPEAQTVSRGSNTTYSATVAALGGFTSDVNLWVWGLPRHAYAQFDQRTISGAGTATLTVHTTHATPAGTYSLRIIGVSGGLKHVQVVSLVVQ